jgi:SAM-dependent methyltransferase
MDMSEILPRNVRKENEQQYGNWPLTADARRYLYLKYAGDPRQREADEQPRDVWAEAADMLDPAVGGRIVDIGASSGYFIEKLLQSGHRGKSEITGIDKAAGHFPFLEESLRTRYDHPNLWLRYGDAERLVDIPGSFAQAASALFIPYHIPRPHRLFSEAHRIVEPGGRILYSSRGTENLTNLWHIAQITAQQHDAIMPPDNFYKHFPLEQLIKALDDSKRSRIIDINIQDDSLYIPATQEGWEDFKEGIISYLPLMRRKRDSRQLSHDEISEFLETEVRANYFESLAKETGGYFPDRVIQGIVTVENIK